MCTTGRLIMMHLQAPINPARSSSEISIIVPLEPTPPCGDRISSASRSSYRFMCTFDERKMGAESSSVGTRLTSRLDRFCEDNSLGIVWAADNEYQCFAHAPGLVRRPDVSSRKR